MVDARTVISLLPGIMIDATHKAGTVRRSHSLPGDNLVIKGERKTHKEEKEKQFHRIERSLGAFQRIIAMPVTADAERSKLTTAKVCSKCR